MSRLQLRPDRWAAGGEAIARDDGGRVVFVRGALPGETVAVELVTEKKDWARGIAVDVVDPVAERVTPPCGARLAGCGGCGWMHLALDAQRRARQAIVADALRRTGGVQDPVVVLGGGVEPEGYRTTVRVAADGEGCVGYHAEASHDVVVAADCRVAHPALRELLPLLRVDPGVEPTIRVSVATGDVAARWDRKAGGVRGLPDHAGRGSDATLVEEVTGHRLRVSMGAFFQSGPQAADLLVDSVRRAAPELTTAGVVVDAYAGVGMFSVCATDPSSHVIAIETSRAAVADATHNLTGRVATIVRGEVGGWRQGVGDAPVDVVIADPARSGLGRPGVNALARTASAVIVLVSCDPASLGRDAKLLAGAGYRHDGSEVIDTFPHTTHVEVVTRFVRA
ncbi:MAG: class I SAM-dependent RNA methyltransferase [Desertimonas sp.]